MTPFGVFSSNFLKTDFCHEAPDKREFRMSEWEDSPLPLLGTMSTTFVSYLSFFFELQNYKGTILRGINVFEASVPQLPRSVWEGRRSLEGGLCVWSFIWLRDCQSNFPSK